MLAEITYRKSQGYIHVTPIDPAEEFQIDEDEEAPTVDYEG